MFAHTVTTRPSGLTLIQVPMKSVQSVTALLFANTGSRYEPQKWWGIAHFLEHMVFKGTKSYPTARDLAASVDGVGAQFNAFTSHEYTGYYVKADSTHLPLALDVLSDMILEPLLRQEDIDREKGVIVEEMNMYADTPTRLVGQLFQQMMFDKESLGHDIIGTKESVTALTAADFKGFLSQWYGYENLILVLAGAEGTVNAEATLTQVDQAFSKGDQKRTANKVHLHLGTLPMTNNKLLVHHKKTEQAHFILGFPVFSCFDERRYALSLLGTILGGNMSSRLFTEVREQRGLCYYVHSDVDLFLDSGIFGASAGADVNRIDEAIQVTCQEFYKIVHGQQPVTDQELQKAKDHVAGKFILDLEESESVAQYYGMRHLVHGTIQTPEETIKKYQEVTLADIEAVVKEVIQPEEVRLTLLGPFKEKERFAKLVKE